MQDTAPDAIDLINRYGTYEIQPTADTENLFPTIAAGRFDNRRLHQLRHQTDIGTDPKATHDLAEDGPNGK